MEVDKSKNLSEAPEPPKSGVIVYKPWQIDHKVQGIVSRHNAMNGTPDKLTVRLYYNKYNLDKGKDFYKAIFEYGKSQVTEPPGAW